MNYHGVVFGEVITGINFVKDFFAGVRNFVGGRSESYEDEMMKARDTACGNWHSVLPKKVPMLW